MSAKSRLSSSALYAFMAGISRMQVIEEMAQARAAKERGTSPALFVSLARLYHHQMLKELRYATSAQKSDDVIARLLRTSECA